MSHASPGCLSYQMLAHQAKKDLIRVITLMATAYISSQEMTSRSCPFGIRPVGKERVNSKLKWRNDVGCRTRSRRGAGFFSAKKKSF